MQIHEITEARVDTNKLATMKARARAPVSTSVQGTPGVAGDPETVQGSDPGTPVNPWQARMNQVNQAYPEVPNWQKSLALKAAKMLRPGGPLPTKGQAAQAAQAQQTATSAQPVAKPAQPAPAVTQPAPIQGGSELQKAQAAGSPARLAVGDNRSELQIAAEPNSIAQRQVAQEPNKAAIPGAPAQATPATPAPAQTYPPITIGAGPKATVYVNKGKGYVDSKSGKPIPPSILKAMGS